MNILTERDIQYLFGCSKAGRKDYTFTIPLDVVDRIKRQLEYYEQKEDEQRFLIERWEKERENLNDSLEKEIFGHYWVNQAAKRSTLTKCITELDVLITPNPKPIIVQGEWYCPKCKSYVSKEQVTYEETHETCNTSVVIWK